MKLKKSWIMIAAVALLLTFAVGGTIAYLAASTPPVVNEFTPGEVETEIKEKDWNKTTKPSITIKNNGTVDVYVRVAIVANWVKDNKIVAPWNGTIDHAENDWTYMEADGYYYYNEVLPAGENSETANLLAEAITYTSEDVPVAGAHLEVTVIHQSIQAEPTAAVQAAWGFVPGSSSN